MVKAYLRYEHTGAFGIVASAGDQLASPPCMITCTAANSWPRPVLVLDPVAISTSQSATSST